MWTQVLQKGKQFLLHMWGHEWGVEQIVIMTSRTCTETCKKYSVTVIFYCIFHKKPQFLKHYSKVNSYSILMIFLPTEVRTYVVFCVFFKIFFWSTNFKYSWFKHKLILFVFKCTIIVFCFWRSKFSFVFNSWTHKIYRL